MKKINSNETDMWEKFKLLCWKNFTLQKRHPVAALFEIGFPILVVLIFAFTKNHSHSQQIPELRFESESPHPYRDCHIYDNLGIYAGGNEKIVELVKSSTIRKSGWEIQIFQNLSSLDSFLANENSTVGLEFEADVDVSLR